MSQLIIFTNASGRVSIVTPVNSSKTLEQIAQGAVPVGVNYWIVNNTDIPTDRTFRDSWEIDENILGIPNGQGGA
jgi:hypothetical protein